ncbi:hypothetical protein BV25DRAFT_1821045 [Artomyces pyxidatus]|uniref:Uncharacterized protein n=1 Tax=Artomyces pyxidatus TaxID=48021 RepID=A0ACB8TCY9_9AGAM|nr:hypothetical protein BV25DRAFT_1821045 [Artomyces pyxidatus]
MDSIDHNFSASGSRLMSESPLVSPFPLSSSASVSDSHTGPGGDDLSISELSLPRRHPPTRPFSLLAQPTEAAGPSHHDETEVEEEELDGGDAEDDEKQRRLAARTRDEKLQNDLFVLRKLNSAFSVYNDALKETQSGTERVAAQLEQTNALLDKYVAILSKSELVTRLIFDERWQGAEADEAVLDEEERIAQEKQAREEEERALAAQRKRERLEKEERERQAQEERDRLERERKAKQPDRPASGVRGVRGTRASMRASATRGVARGAPPASTGASSQTRGSSGIPAPSRIGRPSSVASTRGTGGVSRGLTRRT